MIAVSSVSMRYGSKVLFDSVTTTFSTGRRYGLTGPNGAGKSTFMKLLTGEIAPQRGTVATPAKLGVLRQDQYAFDAFRAIDTVIMGNKRLWSALEEREFLYAKANLTDQDGMRLGELEGIVGEEDADLLPRLEFAHQSLVQRLPNVESLQQHGGIALRRVSVLFSDDPFQFSEAHALVIGEGGLRVEPFAFLKGAPEALVPHHHRIDHAEPIEGKLVLAKHPDLGRRGHGPLLRNGLARQQLHEGGLARSVRARQPVAAAGEETGGDFVEQ